MKKPIFLILLFSSFLLSAQLPNFQWCNRFGNTGNDISHAIAVDASSNVYTTGRFSGTVDFDPGAGVFNLSTVFGSDDCFISKVDASGNFIWAKSIGDFSSDIGLAITTDTFGNVYVSGFFDQTVDFDPGVGTFSLTSSGGYDIFILKLDAAGNFIWAKTMGGTSPEQGYSITSDNAGNIYLTGVFQGACDFDPGAAMFVLTSAGADDMFVVKIDASGNFIWAKSIGSTSVEVGKVVAVDGLGNVYIAGDFNITVDFDPGVGTYTLTSGGNYDMFVLKLDAAGNFVWAKRMGGFTVDHCYGMAIDASSNVYTTGLFTNVADFDPGPGTFNLVQVGSGDIFISKLDASGNFVWAKQMGGSSSEQGNALTLDSFGNIYIIGTLQGPVDFDPGPAVFNLTSNGSADVFISELDAAGNFAWARAFGGTGIDVGIVITTDAAKNVYTSGQYNTTVDFDPNAGTFSLTSAGQSDAFVHKMCQTPVAPLAINGPTSLCSGQSGTYTISNVPFASSYTWNLPAGWLGSGNTNTLFATSGSSGIFSVSANNSCGVGSPQTLSVTVNLPPTISVNSGAICIGNNFTITPSGAATYTIQGGNNIVAPITNTTYTVIGTSAAGCISSTFATSGITVNALPSVSVTSGVICSGDSFTLIPSGANTYTFSNGNAVVSPTSNSTYSVTGTSLQGCISSNTAIGSITVNSLPTINISSNASLVCIGQTVSLTASGALTYSWNTTSTNSIIAVSPTITTSYTVNGVDGNGCKNFATLTQSVSACTGIDAINKNESPVLMLFPNPNNGAFTITANSEMNILILNIWGQLVKTLVVNANTHHNISVTDLPNGIYFITSFDNKAVKQKLIIEK